MPVVLAAIAPPSGVGSQIGDVAALYRALAVPLERTVRHHVEAPEPVIEDACQFAWSRLLYHQRRLRPETVLAWLVATARHEALKLLRRSARDVSLDAVLEDGDEFGAPPGVRSLEELIEARERLAGVRSLTPRQQRVLWLHAIGLSHHEIARRDGCTDRTVERQLERGRARLRARESSVMEVGAR